MSRSDTSRQLTEELMQQCDGYGGGDVIIALADALGMALVALSDDRQSATVGYAYATNLVKSWIIQAETFGVGSAREQ